MLSIAKLNVNLKGNAREIKFWPWIHDSLAQLREKLDFFNKEENTFS